MLVLNELRIQRLKALDAVLVAALQVTALRESLETVPEAEHTEAQQDTRCDLEVELTEACKVFLRLDERYSEECRKLLSPPVPDKPN